MRKVQKTVISGIFPAFLPGKILFGNIRLDDYLAITILHLCAKFQPKILLQCRDMLEKPFFRRFRPFPVIFQQFRVQRRLLPLVWRRFWVGMIKTRLWTKNYFTIVTKMLTGLPKISDFRHISGSTDRKKFFHEKRIPLQPIYNLYASLSKKSQKTNDKILRKVQKTVISGIFPAFCQEKF